jgi:hypothetical protein
VIFLEKIYEIYICGKSGEFLGVPAIVYAPQLANKRCLGIGVVSYCWANGLIHRFFFL